MPDSSSNIFGADIPSPEEFFSKVPLYQEFSTSIFYDKIKAIEEFDGKVDLYCSACERASIFHVNKYDADASKYLGSKQLIEGYSQQKPYVPSAFFTLIGICSRNSNHRVYFSFHFHNDAFQKVGQYPSIADLEKYSSRKYRKLLKEKYTEFTKAIGLVSHGIGIGSFVYMRRIFEYLIEEAHYIAKTKENWDDVKYKRSGIAEKIKYLKDELPQFLVKNHSIYSILSKGIHELSEEECLKYFIPIKNGIELILDENLEKQEKVRKIKETENKIAEIKNLSRI
ncbi:MAG TPA: hypothetical protein VHO43_04035 [Ignavibacteriales bacterium]|nr:hypothetical protein [Ignavibacteriales bacterium]